MTPFALFGRSHLTALVLSLIIPAALVALTGATRRVEAPIRWILAAILIGVWVWWYVLAYHRGWLTIGDGLPMNLCDWATIATIVALLHPNQKAYELSYFWALGGTVQGMITPDTPYDFPEARFLIFFVYHGGIIAAVLTAVLQFVFAFVVLRVSAGGGHRRFRARHELRIPAREARAGHAVQCPVDLALVHSRTDRARISLRGDLLRAVVYR